MSPIGMMVVLSVIDKIEVKHIDIRRKCAKHSCQYESAHCLNMGKKPGK